MWSGLCGAAAMTVLGFSVFGWTTGGTARRMAADGANTAVLAALVPFCLAKAKDDADPARLIKWRAESSSYSRSDIVRAAGWATLPGMTSPDYNLSTACSERLASAAAAG